MPIGNAYGPKAIQGARAERSTGQSLTGGVTTAMIWQTEVFDDNGMIDIAGNPTRITVPIGVTRVCVDAGIDTGSVSQATIQVGITKNGGGLIGESFVGIEGAFGGSKGISLSTGIINVVAGDFFEVKVVMPSTDTIDAVAATSLSMTTYN